jgi:hypothetical protein
MDIEERDEKQNNSIDNLFNSIKAENFPNLEKGRDILLEEAYRTPSCKNQKRNTSRCITIKILNTQ